MILTNKQEEALKIAVKRYKDKEPYTCIAGYAGTGKSTVIKFIIAALNLKPEDDVAYVSFTGKAASVLRHKGCPNATTAHKLLYYSKRLPNGKYKFSPRKSFERPYKLIIVDEISMLPIDLWELLLSHNVPVIACGDPFQIPPINPKADNHVLDNPHVFLDEIMRQAQESEIVRLSMDIRNYKRIDYVKGNEVMIIPEEEAVSGVYDWADQILCATNKKRTEINSYMRERQQRGLDPENGDKIIATKNQWNTIDLTGSNALVNGTIGYLSDIHTGTLELPYWLNIPNIPILSCNLLTEEDGVFDDLIVDYTNLKEGKPFLTPEQGYKLYKNELTRELEPIVLDYGYAITGHRAQGSEWKKVLVFEETFPFKKEEHARWLYTCCTRPSEKLVLVK